MSDQVCTMIEDQGSNCAGRTRTVHGEEISVWIPDTLPRPEHLLLMANLVSLPTSNLLTVGHQTSTVKMRIGSSPWRWTRVVMPLSTSKPAPVSEHVLASRDSSLCDPHRVTRSFASALYCGVTATGLRKPLSMNTPLQPESTV